MKVSYDWLRDYCDCPFPAEELAARLSDSAFNVESCEPAGPDWVLDVEVTTNRPDCLCHLGLAREVAAIARTQWHAPHVSLVEDGSGSFSERSSVAVVAQDLCPHYTARLVVAVQVAPSPRWLQERLASCGVRPVNNVVDATNYAMLECGQPLHAFDFGLLEEGRIVVRRSEPGETITTIDGTPHELTGKECVIADAVKPVALAGVMGGAESEISGATTDVLIEAARFDPVSVRRTSRAHGLASESSYRFERGVDPEITDWASRRVCELIADLTHGTVLSGVGQSRSDRTAASRIVLRIARLRLLLGIDVPCCEVSRILQALGLTILDEGTDAIAVRAPSWRPDLSREVDLIEEVARIHGYNKVAETTNMVVRPVRPSRSEVVERRTRVLLAGHGFTEVLTHSLVNPTAMQRSQPWYDGEPLAVRNPFTADRTHMRLTCMANLAHTKRVNLLHGADQVDLFEIGNVYLPVSGRQQPDEKQCLAALTDQAQGLRIVKGTLANLLCELRIDAEVQETPGATGPFDADEAVSFRLNGGLLGCAGVLSSGFARELDLPDRPALMEVDLGLLRALMGSEATYRPVPRFPAARRDMAVVVREGVLWAEVERCVRTAAPLALDSLSLFDVYRGGTVPAGHKSMAFSLAFRLPDRTVTSDQADDAVAAILAALGSSLGARLR
jgi:phenylalanyl-tRNA synthetase beta chain